MLKSLLAVLVTLALASGSAKAQAVFDGVLFYVTAANCQFTTAPARYTSRFTPANVGGNPARTTLTANTLFFGDAYETLAGPLISTFKVVNAVGFGNSAFTYRARVRITAQNPATITANTVFVSMVGQIEGPRTDPGIRGQKCLVTFRAAFVKNP